MSQYPSASAEAQQSLNVLDDTLVIEKLENGGHKTVVDEVPESDDDNWSIREIDSEVGKPEVEYPLDREYATVSKYRVTRSYRTGRSTRYTYKVFDISIDREAAPDDASRIENILQVTNELSDLKKTVGQIETYAELQAKQRLVRRYEAICELVKSIWANDSLKSYATTETAPSFEIEQYSQGFYCTTYLHHSTTKEVLSQKLSEHGISGYSTAWGGFILSPDEFGTAHKVLEPAYATPEKDPALELY